MKNNHQQVEALLRQAISACSYDNSLSETKSYLGAALRSVQEVGKKRSRSIATQKAIEEGQKKYKEWWEMLKKNAAENIDLGWLKDDDMVWL